MSSWDLQGHREDGRGGQNSLSLSWVWETLDKELIQNLLWGVCGLHFLNLERKSAVLAFLKSLLWGLKLGRIQEAIHGREEAPNQTRSRFAVCASDTGYYTVILIFLSEDLFPCYKMVVSLPTLEILWRSNEPQAKKCFYETESTNRCNWIEQHGRLLTDITFWLKSKAYLARKREPIRDPSEQFPR